MSKNYPLQVFFFGFALAVCSNTLQAQTSLITPAPTSVSLGFQKPSTAGTPVAVVLQAVTTATFFTVDPTTVPIWLSVSAVSGTAGITSGTAFSLTFTASAICASLGAGTFSGNVHIKSLNYSDLVIPVSVLIKDPAGSLSVKGGATQYNNVIWHIGAAVPAYTLTLVSSNQPLSFSIAAASTITTTGAIANWLTLGHPSGVAYSWGTPIGVTFAPLAFLEAQAGDTLASVVTITIPTGTVTVPFNIHVAPPVATITSLFPSSVPVNAATTGSVTIAITGTGFITGPSGQTTIVTLNLATDVLATVTVVSTTTISVAIPLNGTTAYLAAAGTPVTIGVYNPAGGTVTTETSTLALPVTVSPIITAITSASTFIQASAPANPTFAPYDIISLFGSNFCPDCDGTTNPATMLGTPDPTYSRYAKALTWDAGTHNLVVNFNKASDHSLISAGYLLFATNNQINVFVPAGVGTLIGSASVEVVVTYGVSGALNTSPVYLVNIAAADPGVFTANSNGQGQGAILHADYTLNSTTNKATKGTTNILVYMTGLGAPSSAASNVAALTAPTYPGGCISALGVAQITGPPLVPAVIGYMTTVNTAVSGYTPPSPAWTSLDGAVILSSQITANHFPPCMSAVTATIAGVAATVSYAGFVSDSIAGLYQVNMLVPSTITVPTTGPLANQVPVVVTIGGKSSQSNVTMFVN
jgi:uncharacterized protein (TIGR03437 family)